MHTAGKYHRFPWLIALICMAILVALPVLSAEEGEDDASEEASTDAPEKPGDATGGEQAGEQSAGDQSADDSIKEEYIVKLPRDLSGFSDEQLDRLLVRFKEKRLSLDNELATIPGAQYEERRSILYRKKDQVDEYIQRVRGEIKQRRENKLESQLSAIRQKFAAQIEEIEARKAAERDQTIQRFEQTLEQNPDSDLAPDILYRLAALYLEKEHDLYLQQMMAYEDEVDALMEKGEDVVPLEPRKTYQKSINIYQKIVNRYPDFHHMDGVLYNLAFCLGETGSFDEADETFAKLIEADPESKFVAEAYVRMGEYRFDSGDFEGAIERYEHVLKYKDSTFFDKALYKLGWSYYKLNDFDKARSFFTKVVDFSEQKRRASLRSDDLRSEAITYIAISFADDQRYEFGGGDQAALAYFRDEIGGRDWEVEVLAAVGNVYFERAVYEGSRSAYNMLLETDPNNPRNPEYVKKIIESYEREQEYELAIAEGERLARLFGVESQWRQNNIEDPEAVELAENLIQTSLFASATFHHENAQLAPAEAAGKRRNEYALAVTSYRQFLKEFPESDKAYEARFNLAEALYFSRQYRAAAEEYLNLLEYPEGKHYKDAAFSLIKSYDDLIAKEGGLPKPPPSTKGVTQIPRKELSTTAQGFADANLLYVKLFPEDKRNADYFFKAGEVYYYHGQYEMARDIFDKVVRKYPNSKAAKLSANLTIESLKAEERYTDVEVVAKRYAKIGSIITTKEEKRQIDILIQDAAFVAAQKAQAAGDFPVAVSEYLRAASEHPNLENAPKALHNAAVIYEKNLHNIYKANELYAEVARRYPKWDGASNDLFHAAYNYEKIVEIERAMDLYEQFGTMFPRREEAADALFNAALLREKNKEYSKAISIYKRHLNQYPGSADSGMITFSIAGLYEEMGQVGNHEVWLLKYVRGYNDPENLIEAYCKLGKIFDSRKQYREAANLYAKSMAIYKKVSGSGIDSRYAAEAWFRFTETNYRKYVAIEFSLPQRKMARQLEQKAKLWKTLREEYQRIIALGNFEWATASLYRIGLICRQFADALFNAPVPKDLTDEEQDIYIIALEDKAFPIESKAIEAFETCVAQARQYRYRNDWVDMAYDNLMHYKPDTEEAMFEIPTPDVSDVLYDYPELVMLED